MAFLAPSVSLRNLLVTKSPEDTRRQLLDLEIQKYINPELFVFLDPSAASALPSSSASIFTIQPSEAEEEWLLYGMMVTCTNLDGGDILVFQYRDAIQAEGVNFLTTSVGEWPIDETTVRNVMWPNSGVTTVTNPVASTNMFNRPLSLMRKSNKEPRKQVRVWFKATATLGTRTLRLRYIYAPRPRLYD